MLFAPMVARAPHHYRAWVNAPSLALEELCKKGLITAMPLRDQVAAISCGMVDGGRRWQTLIITKIALLETDANFVPISSGGIVEIQGTAEQHPFSEAQLLAMMGMANQVAKAAI